MTAEEGNAASCFSGMLAEMVIAAAEVDSSYVVLEELEGAVDRSHVVPAKLAEGEGGNSVVAQENFEAAENRTEFGGREEMSAEVRIALAFAVEEEAATDTAAVML